MKKNNPLPPLSPTALAEQKKVAAAMKINLPADWKSSADVIVVTVGSTEDRFLKGVQRDFAALAEEAAPLVLAARKRAAAIAPRNKETSQKAKARHQKIREVARELKIRKGEWGRRGRIQTELAKRGLRVSLKQITHALQK
jgi:hypothetical protein